MGIQIQVSTSVQNETLINEIKKRYSVKRNPISEIVKTIQHTTNRTILFVYPPKWKGVSTAYGENLPLAILHRAQDAEKAGWKSHILNLTKENDPEQSLLNAVVQLYPQVISFSTTSASEAFAFTLAHSLCTKKMVQDCLITKGGPGSEYSFPELKPILSDKSPIDLFFLGDADASFTTFLNHIGQGNFPPLIKLQGIGFLGIDQPTVSATYDGMKARELPPAKKVLAMNENAFPILLYNKENEVNRAEKHARFQTATKCGYACGFCAISRILGPQTRKQVKEVTSYVASLLELGISNFYFEDATFAIDKIGKGVFTQQKDQNGLEIPEQKYAGWTDEFLDQMIRLKKKYAESGTMIRFGIQTRIDTLTDDVFVKKLAEAGCTNVFLGIETLNRDSLISMHKGTMNPEDLLKILFQRLENVGINATISLIVGKYTGSLEDFEHTLKKLCEWNVPEIFMQAAAVYPGTDDWRNMGAEEKRNVVLSYLRPNFPASRVSTTDINPEDKMQYGIDDPPEIEKYYKKANETLRGLFMKLNEGHYIRKDIYAAFPNSF